MANLEELAAEAAALSVRQVPNAEAVNAAASRPLYAERIKVYPQRVDGLYRRLKWAFMAIALGLYYFLPWVRWDRGPGTPDQAVLADFPARKFYFFWIELWPHEIYYLTGLLILAALLLFLVTSLFGRVWCGYACPQTVWTDLFVHVERFIEGDRNARMRLDKASLSAGKIFKKTVKHAAWIVIAIATGGAWVFYFADAPTLMRDFLSFSAPKPAYLFLALFAGFTYVLGGWAREQVCTYMCPWPRIQGAMFDDDALLVTYRAYRGEPRGAHKKGEPWDDRGDCVDCRRCVAVCPMGIDIRDGPQLECIQCALCIDACSDIMAKVDRPRGLIAYESYNNFERRARSETPRFHLIRARTVTYAILIMVVTAVMVGSLFARADLGITVQKDRNPLFVALSDGSVRNVYTVKILNKAHVPRHLNLEVTGLEGARLSLGLGQDGTDIDATADAVEKVRVFIDLPRARLGQLDRGNADISLVVRDRDSGTQVAAASFFKGPRR